MTEPCQCTEAGWCERHQVNKPTEWVRLCQTNEKYRAAWDEGRGPGQIHASPTPDGEAPTPANETSEPSHGPGTALCKLLGCGCGIKQHIVQLNDWGVDGCREHTEQIVAWLVECGTCYQGSIDEQAARRLLNIALDHAAAHERAASMLVPRSGDPL